MSLKYDFTPGYVNNPFMDVFVETIINTNTILAYIYIIIAMVVSYYVFTRVQDDPGLSLLQSGWIGFISSMLIFYLGVEISQTLISGKLIALFVVLLSLATGWIYINRSQD